MGPSPILFRHLIDFVRDYDENNPRGTAGALILTTAILYLGVSISKAYYTRLGDRVMTCIRGALVTAVSQKMMNLRSSVLEESSATTHMSLDIDSIEMAILKYHDAWASVVEVIIGVYMLAQHIGPAAYLIILPPLIASGVTAFAVKYMSQSQATWNKMAESRLNATASFLSQIKAVKMSGLMEPYGRYIQTLRQGEIEISLSERRMRVTLHAIEGLVNTFPPIIAISSTIFWKSSSTELSVTDIFVTLSVVLIIIHPLSRMLISIPHIVASFICIGRIQTFLILEEVSKDTTDTFTERTPIASSSAASREKHAELDQDEPCTIGLANVSVTCPIKGTEVLKDVSIEFDPGSVTGIIGPVGCGKTMLLRALLGEVQASKGRVTCSHTGEVAYCGQTAWLQNISIKEIVIGQKKYDEALYKKVVKACALRKDFEILPDGDATLAGSGGCSLSGGQKQRIALARAVYSLSSIIILDDVFSALDASTSRFVLSQLLGADGIVRKSGATVILATSTIDNLSVVDATVAINPSGGLEHIPKKTAMLGGGSSLLRSLPKHVRDAENTASSCRTSTQNPTVATEAVNVERQRGDVSIYGYYLRATGWGLFLAWMFTACTAAVADRMPHIFIHIWMDVDPQNTAYYPWYILLSVAGSFCLYGCIWFYYFILVTKSSQVLHLRLLRTVMSATLDYLSETDTGSLLARFGQDISLISQLLPKSLMEFSIISIMAIIDVVVIAQGATYAFIVVPFCGLCLYFVQFYYLRTSRQIRYLDTEAKTPLFTHFAETQRGVEHIRAFKWQEAVLQQSITLLDESQRPFYYLSCTNTWLILVLDLVIMAMAVILVTFSTLFPGTSSPSSIGLSLVILVGFSENLSNTVRAWVRLESSLGAVFRTREFEQNTPVERPVRLASTALPEFWPRYGRIDLTSVTARYSTNASTQPILSDLNLTIQPGQKVGITGRTGSGKSSLLLTILNLLNFSGTLLIDGVSVTKVPHEFLRSRIITLPQDGVEIGGTIRGNLDPYSEAPCLPSDETLTEVLRRVGLAEFVKQHGGLDAKLTATRMSHGQKQLLCLARAILRKESVAAKIVLVDEATSSIDYETGQQIHAVMAKAFSDCTVITVAHRLQALEGTDVVFDLEQGKIKQVLEKDSDEWKTWEQYTNDCMMKQTEDNAAEIASNT